MSSNLIIDVKRNLLSNYVKKTKLPIVADFWAPWCGPCSRFKPTIEALAKHFAGKLQILKVNIDENDDTAEAYQIVNIPTLIIFNAKGVRIQTIKGQKTLPQLIQTLEALPIF